MKIYPIFSKYLLILLWTYMYVYHLFKKKEKKKKVDFVIWIKIS